MPYMAGAVPSPAASSPDRCATPAPSTAPVSTTPSTATADVNGGQIESLASPPSYHPPAMAPPPGLESIDVRAPFAADILVEKALLSPTASGGGSSAR